MTFCRFDDLELLSEDDVKYPVVMKQYPTFLSFDFETVLLLGAIKPSTLRNDFREDRDAPSIIPT
jgi:hypothetical protein